MQLIARRFAKALAALIPLLLSSCGNGSANETGNLAASRRGDIDLPALPTAAMDRVFSTQCGAMAELAPTIHRAPYLQRIAPDAALVLWTGTEAAEVVVTTPEGELVGEVTATVDTSAPLDVGSQWVAALTELRPATVYCYQLIGEGGALSGPIGFRTAPARGAEVPVSFLAFGDSGSGGEDQKVLAERMRGVPYDVILHTGDVVYGGSGALVEFEDLYFDVYEPLIRSVPVFLASGNHDYLAPDAEPFRQVFALPENGAPMGVERWYSFDYGPVHVVVLDTEKIGPAQIAWLDADLTANDLPWTIVVAHRPPFSSGWHGSDRSVRDAFVPLFVEHGVQLVLNGHEHHYERTEPIDGVTYVITGGGGRGTRGVGHGSFTAFAESVIHFVHVEVDGFELTLRAIDGTGVMFDGVVIRR